MDSEVEFGSAWPTEVTRRLLDLTSDLACVANFDGFFEELSSGWTQVLGYEADEMMGRPLLDFVHPEDRADTAETLAEGRDGTDITSFENRFVASDGSTRWLLWTAIALPDERRYHAVARDRTPQREAEEQARESENRYADLIESSHDIVQSITPDGHFNFVNKAWHDHLGYTAEELPDVTLFDIVAEADHEHCTLLIGQIMSGKSFDSVEVTFVTKDGRRFPVEGNATGRFRDGEFVATHTFFRDVSDRKEAERLTAEYQHSLEQEVAERTAALIQSEKLATLGRLSAGMAHELNNPAQFTASNLAYLAKSFSNVRGILQNTLDWARTEQSRLPFAAQLAEQCQRVALEDILRETPLAVDEALEGIRRMAHVIRELKEFAGEPGAELADLELNQALCNVVEVSRSTWSSRVELFLDLHPEPLVVRAAAHPIKQAILNLLNNAVEAVERLGRSGNVVIASAPIQGGVEISISDDGPGIAPELQQHLFEPFFTTKGLGQGMGQGLFVAHAIVVEQHRGRLWCESRPGSGATFRLWLPLSAVPGAVSNERVPSIA